ncbi:aldo/keto reductase [Schaalia vaccimaxillae]|uniref:aldo/keto reductase n=1 Tax=Schaalia vaccimaxillae TaxID=183916 RepID=UPI0003B544E5|nr:aldo/keto reductase [Schaalia vaccimaxillae]
MTRIGTSELDIRPFALGGNTFGWTSDQSESFKVLDAFVGEGGSLVDTADVYSAWAQGNKGGESEEILGLWFERNGHRDDVFVATKVAKHPDFPGLGADNIRRAADASLKRLKSDHIDLYYAHAEDPDTPIVESVAAFAQLVQAGKVRYLALSNFSAASIREWMAEADRQGVDRPVALQPHYNLVTRADFENELRGAAEEFELGVIPYFSLASGFLTGKYRNADEAEGARGGMVGPYVSDQGFAVIDELRAIAQAHNVELATVALAWLRVQPTVVAPIASASSVEQLPALLASTFVELNEDEVERLTKVSEGL